MSLNSVILLAKVVKQPELRYTPGGKAVATARLMVPRDSKDDGVDFVDGEVWERSAEAIVNNPTIVGTWLIWTGRLRIEEYEKDGQKRSKTKVVGNYKYVPGTAPAGGGKPAAENGSMGGEPNFRDEDDVPF